MKHSTKFSLVALLVLLSSLVSPWSSLAIAQNTDVAGIWNLSAQGTSTGCTEHTPCKANPPYLCGINICGSFQMGDADIHVSQSGNVLSALEGDVNGNRFTLNGTINGDVVAFTIRGFGITPGIGPATTTYTGILNGNIISGNLSGYASWSYQDTSGNSITETATWTGAFTVTIAKVYTFSGFFQPVDNPPIVNSLKAGAAIPIKFSLGKDYGLDILANDSPVSQAVGCSTSNPIDAIGQTVTAGGSSLSYDPSANQYTYVWKTDQAWAGTCRQFTLTLNDGSAHQASFQFTK